MGIKMLSKPLLISTELFFRQGIAETLPGERIRFRYSEATAYFSWKPTGCLKGFSTRWTEPNEGIGSYGTPFQVDLEAFHGKRADKTHQQVQKHHRYPDLKG